METRRKRLDNSASEDNFQAGVASYSRRFDNSRWSAPRWSRFTDVDAIWDYILSFTASKRKLYIFGYDLARFAAASAGFQHLIGHGWQNTSRIIGQNLLSLTFKHAGKTLVLLDTVNLFRSSPAEMAAAFGFDVPVPAIDAPPRSSAPLDMQTEASVLMASLVAWFSLIQKNSYGSFARTLASQSMAAYRHRFMNVPIYINANDDAQELSRRALYGGRSEAYLLGPVRERVWALDCQSMYPYIASREPVPVKLMSTYRTPTLYDLEYLIRTSSIVADVEINTDEPAYPYRLDGMTTFPVGRFRTVLTTPELAHAVDRGHIETVKAMNVYWDDVIFHEFVSHFWELRSAARDRGDLLTEGLAKALLNSLFGKFSQRGEIWKSIGRTADLSVRYWSEWDVADQRSYQYRQLLGLIEEYETAVETRESFPAITAHITAAARMYLYQLIQEAGPENTLYTDTDSLFVTADGLARLDERIAEGELGALRIQWMSDKLIINGVKDYMVDDVRTIKGIKYDAVERSPGRFVQAEYQSLESMVRSGSIGRRLITDVEKVLHREYLKGSVDRSGAVHPLRIRP